MGSNSVRRGLSSQYIPRYLFRVSFFQAVSFALSAAWPLLKIVLAFAVLSLALEHFVAFGSTASAFAATALMVAIYLVSVAVYFLMQLRNAVPERRFLREPGTMVRRQVWLWSIPLDAHRRVFCTMASTGDDGCAVATYTFEAGNRPPSPGVAECVAWWVATGSHLPDPRHHMGLPDVYMGHPSWQLPQRCEPAALALYMPSERVIYA
jgi:hypothetical protein